MLHRRLVHALSLAGFAQPPVVIDGHPRIRQRMVDNLRRRRRRDDRMAASLALLVGLGLLATGLARSPLLALDTIAIKGLSTPQRQVVSDRIGIAPGVNVLDLDLRALDRRVESLPWVRQATLRRRLPSTLEVRVATVRPVARTRVDGILYLLDDAGKAVEALPGDAESQSLLTATPTDLPHIDATGTPTVGRPAGDLATEAAAVVAAGMPPRIAEWIIGYDAVAHDRVDARLRVRTTTGTLELTAHLGRPERLRAKSAALEALLREVVTRGLEPRSLDVRIPDRPVVRP